MPRFAANTAYLFSDRPLIERFGAAAKAGFAAVEGQFPYETPPSAVKAELQPPQPHHARHQHRARRGGAVRARAMPGRERDFDALIKQSLDYITAIGGSAIHVLAGKVPVNERPGGRAGLYRQPDARGRPGGGKEHHAS